MNIDERFSYLLKQYSKGTISFEEKAEFFDLVATGRYDDIIAEDLIEHIQDSGADDLEEMPSHASQEVLKNILSTGKKTPEIPRDRRHLNSWLIAASIMAILLTSVNLYLNREVNAPEAFMSEYLKDKPDQVVNRNASALTVTLNDGSEVLLQPGSALHYSGKSFNEKREVYMEGEATFNITKNPQKPFFVYYQDVVTKVLGTSFNIRTSKLSGNVEVEVLTGRVQVYENQSIHKDSRRNSGLIVTPNQKAVYQASRRSLEAQLVDFPQVVIKHDEKDSTMQEGGTTPFEFENAKLSEVLKSIGQSYGIEITVNNERLNDCPFTGDVSSQDLFNKLKIICLATNADYEIIGTNIILKGNGCN